METAKKWFASTTKGDSVNAVAAKSGLTQSTLARYHKKGEYPADAVIAISRAYGVSAIRSLLAIGLLTEHDLDELRLDLSLEAASDIDLAGEIYRRTARQGRDLETFNG